MCTLIFFAGSNVIPQTPLICRGPEQLPLRTQDFVETTVQDTCAALDDLKSALVVAGDQSRVVDRLKFAVMHQKSIKKAEIKLEQAKSSLIVSLQLLDLQISKSSFAILSDISSGQQRLQHQVEATTGLAREARTDPRIQQHRRSTISNKIHKENAMDALICRNNRADVAPQVRYRTIYWWDSSIRVGDLPESIEADEYAG